MDPRTLEVASLRALRPEPSLGSGAGRSVQLPALPSYTALVDAHRQSALLRLRDSNGLPAQRQPRLLQVPLPGAGADETRFAVRIAQSRWREGPLQPVHGVREDVPHGHSHPRLLASREACSIHRMHPLSDLCQRLPNRGVGGLLGIRHGWTRTVGVASSNLQPNAAVTKETSGFLWK